MADVNIGMPPKEVVHFRQLAEIGLETLTRLAEELSARRPLLNSQELAKSVAESTSVGLPIVSSALGLLNRLAMIQRRFDLSVDELISGVTANLEQLPYEEWNVSHRDAWTGISQFLTAFLNSPNAVTMSAKASDLLVEQRTVLCSSRIVTDARPVFDDSAESVIGVVQVHTLVLRCSEAGMHKDYYIACDSDDLQNLKKQIERAEKKERLMSAKLEIAGLTRITTE